MRGNAGFEKGRPDVRFEVESARTRDATWLERAQHDPRFLTPNSPYMGGREPDPGFLEDLAIADPNMFAVWNPFLCGDGRWTIWRKNVREGGEPYLVCPVVHPQDDSYVPLDKRVIALLYQSDPEKYGGVKEMYRSVMARQDRDAESRKKRIKDRFDNAMEAARTAVRPWVGAGGSNCGDKVGRTERLEGREVTEADNPLR